MQEEVIRPAQADLLQSGTRVNEQYNLETHEHNFAGKSRIWRTVDFKIDWNHVIKVTLKRR